MAILESGRRLVIADLTDSNPNVFYELGIAHTLGKEVIMIAQHVAIVPFDVGHVRYIRYVYPSGVEQLEQKLKETIIQVLGDSQPKTRVGAMLPVQDNEQVPTPNLRQQRVAVLTTWTRQILSESDAISKMAQQLKKSYHEVSYWTISQQIVDAASKEATRRWSLAPGTTRGYGDNVFISIESEVRTRIENEAKKEGLLPPSKEADFGVLLGQPFGERGKLSTAMESSERWKAQRRSLSR